MTKPIFQGAACALVTPMLEDGSVDYGGTEELVEFQIAGGTDALVVAGTTGEASTLTADEQIGLVRFLVGAVRGRVPVIAGAGSNDTARAHEYCAAMEEAGADALLLVTPYYNKCSQEGLYRHYRACAEATGLPIMLYNVPGRTGVSIGLDTYERLAEIANVVAVKEASGDLGYLARLLARCGERYAVYTGNDETLLPALSLGAQGVVSVLSNLCPGVPHRVCYHYFCDEPTCANKLMMEYEDLAAALFADVNPIPVKTALNLMGFRVGGCRLPLCEMSGAPLAELKRALAAHGLIDPTDPS